MTMKDTYIEEHKTLFFGHLCWIFCLFFQLYSRPYSCYFCLSSCQFLYTRLPLLLQVSKRPSDNSSLLLLDPDTSVSLNDFHLSCVYLCKQSLHYALLSYSGGMYHRFQKSCHHSTKITKSIFEGNNLIFCCCYCLVFGFGIKYLATSHPTIQIFILPLICNFTLFLFLSITHAFLKNGPLEVVQSVLLHVGISTLRNFFLLCSCNNFLESQEEKP